MTTLLSQLDDAELYHVGFGMGTTPDKCTGKRLKEAMPEIEATATVQEGKLIKVYKKDRQILTIKLNDQQYAPKELRNVKVILHNGDYFETPIRGTEEEIRDYYENKIWESNGKYSVVKEIIFY